MTTHTSPHFDFEVLETFLTATQADERPRVSAALLLGSDALKPDMVLAADLISPQGVLLLAAGHRLTDPLISRVRAFERRVGQEFQLQIRRYEMTRRL